MLRARCLALVATAALGVTALAGCSHAPSSEKNTKAAAAPSSPWPGCLALPGWKESSQPGWGSAPLTIRLLARASAPCPGKDHPAIVIAQPRADAWIQVVRISRPPERQGRGLRLPADRGSWAFVDTSDDARAKGDPFYIREPEPRLHDNPLWGGAPDPGEEPLRWEAFAFPVQVTDTPGQPRRITPLGGVAWGFEWRPGEAAPRALPVEWVAPGLWEQWRPGLQVEYPDWRFSGPQVGGMAQAY